MYLTSEEEAMLKGEYGPAISRAMEILVTLGEVYEAPSLIDIRSVHMPGSSIIVSGLAGLKFVESFSKQNARFKTYTTLNTGAIDFEKNSRLPVLDDVNMNQKILTEAYVKMDAVPCHTCTPYLVGNIIKFGEHCAWGESSAVIFANSVLGGRTNREGGPSALASAITGKTPFYGFHVNDNRLADYLINLKVKLQDISDYGALGYFIGKIVGGEVPAFKGVGKDVSLEELKMLGAALASSGSVSLFHIEGVTPESYDKINFKAGNPKDSIEVDRKEISEVYERLRVVEKGERIDLACVGCPHCSLKEIFDIAALLHNKHVNEKTKLWVLTSLPVKTLAERLGLTKIIEKSGGEIICDTCPVLGPMKRLKNILGVENLATNSAKLAHYAPGQCNLKPYYGSLNEVVEAAIRGGIKV